MVLAVLMMASEGIAAQAALVSAWTENQTVLATVVLGTAPVGKVLGAVHEGLKSEIIFDLRLYRRQKRFLAWLGDRPVESRREVRIAAFDPFTNRYVVERGGEIEATFSEQNDFLRYFLSLAEYPVGEVDPADPGGYYVLARVRLSPVRLIPPLNIVSLFFSDSLVTTDWVEKTPGRP